MILLGTPFQTAAYLGVKTAWKINKRGAKHPH